MLFYAQIKPILSSRDHPRSDRVDAEFRATAKSLQAAPTLFLCNHHPEGYFYWVHARRIVLKGHAVVAKRAVVSQQANGEMMAKQFLTFVCTNSWQIIDDSKLHGTVACTLLHFSNELHHEMSALCLPNVSANSCSISCVKHSSVLFGHSLNQS